MDLGSACDCSALRPVVPAGDVLVYSRAGHVARRLGALLAASGAVQPYDAHAYRLGVGALAQLTALYDRLRPSERGEVWIMGLSGDRPDYLGGLPLTQWLTRTRSPWFGQAYSALHFAYQPIFDLHTGAPCGQEALMRARVLLDGCDQELGALPLLEAAQAHGELRALDARARREAIAQGGPRLKAGQSLFINFSPAVVYDPEVCLQTTFAACREAGLDPARLVFEVTESEAFPDLSVLGAVLARYRREGMRVALDDLGAGHTSLLYLEALRPDLVKLDRGLIRGIHDHDPRAALVGALIRYAHDLGVQVVAEGIETERELRQCVRLGADAGQGYLLGRPEPEPDARQTEGSRALIQQVVAEVQGRR
jgi:EAL domain-containing protein (putative c-di-GMP-specific phosphodiesterase class I)